MPIKVATLFSFVTLFSTVAYATDNDKDQYNLFSPTPADQMRSFSTDRPGKMDTPYSVDAGHFQTESDIWNYSHSSFADDGSNTTTKLTAIFPTNFKVGLTSDTEFQLIEETYLNQRVKDNITGTTEKADGFGDVTTRIKFNLWGNDGGTSAFAAIPYVKFATNADHLENRLPQFGASFPFNYSLNSQVALSHMFQYNRAPNSTDSEYHNEFINVEKVTYNLTPEVAGYTELFELISDEPHQSWQSSMDFAVEYLMTPNSQLDVGCNFGLTQNQPEYNPFIGLSFRF